MKENLEEDSQNYNATGFLTFYNASQLKLMQTETWHSTTRQCEMSLDTRIQTTASTVAPRLSKNCGQIVQYHGKVSSQSLETTTSRLDPR